MSEKEKKVGDAWEPDDELLDDGTQQDQDKDGCCGGDHCGENDDDDQGGCGGCKGGCGKDDHDDD